MVDAKITSFVQEDYQEQDPKTGRWNLKPTRWWYMEEKSIDPETSLPITKSTLLGGTAPSVKKAPPCPEDPNVSVSYDPVGKRTKSIEKSRATRQEDGKMDCYEFEYTKDFLEGKVDGPFMKHLTKVNHNGRLCGGTEFKKNQGKTQIEK